MSDTEASAKEEKQGTAGFGSSTVNLLKSIIGSGILSLPAAFASYGAIPGTLLLATAALLSAFGLQLLVLAADRIASKGLMPTRSGNFASLAGPTYPNLWVVFEAAVLVKCTLVATSYLTVATTVSNGIIIALAPNAWSIFHSHLFWATLLVCIIAPFTYMHRIDSLKYTSLLGLLGIVYLFILSVILFFTFNDSVAESFSNIRPFVKPSFTSLSKFSVFVFALTCHQNVCYNYLYLSHLPL